MSQIAIIDYGMGNIGNVKNALDFLGFPNLITRDVVELEKSEGIILPGVGAFGAAMKNLEDYHLIAPILRHIENKKPFLGICLGLQLLFEKSEESPDVHGLGLLPGTVLKFPKTDLKVPHMGWNSVKIRKRNSLVAGLQDLSYFYFVHSYFVPDNKADFISTTTDYGIEFVSGVAQDNLFAFQFHPEKSQSQGLHIYKNFGDLCENYTSN